MRLLKEVAAAGATELTALFAARSSCLADNSSQGVPAAAAGGGAGVGELVAMFYTLGLIRAVRAMHGAAEKHSPLLSAAIGAPTSACNNEAKLKRC